MRSVLTLLGLLVAVTALAFGAVIGAHFAFGLSLGQTLSLLAWTLLAHGVLMILTVHLWTRQQGLQWSFLGFRKPTKRILHLLWQIPLLIVAIAVANAVFLTLIGQTNQAGGGSVEDLSQQVSALAVLALFFTTVILVPLWEEAVHRGVIFSALRPRMGLMWVCVITAGIFALSHMIPPLIPYYIVLGIGLALLREFHQNLWAPLIMHSTLNLFAGGTILLALALSA